MKILVALSADDTARTATEMAIRLATALDAQVDVVSVVPLRTAALPVDPWGDEPIHDRVLREADARFRSVGIEPRLHEPLGDPATRIEELAESGRYDLVVVGARPKRSLGRLLQGSVSEHVAGHTTTSVIVAR